MTKLLNVTQAADLLSVSKGYLNKARLTGGSPPWVTVGRAVRYRQEDLDAWILARLRRSTSDRGEKAA